MSADVWIAAGLVVLLFAYWWFDPEDRGRAKRLREARRASRPLAYALEQRDDADRRVASAETCIGGQSRRADLASAERRYDDAAAAERAIAQHRREANDAQWDFERWNEAVARLGGRPRGEDWLT